MDGSSAETGTSAARRVLATLAAVLALAPVAVAIAMGSGGGSASASAAVASSTGVSANPLGLTVTGLPAALSAGPGHLSALPPGQGALVAVLHHPTTMRARPNGPALGRVGLRTEFGSPQVLWVVKHTPRWLGVVSPQAGNGRLGWIAISSASLARSDWEIRVSLSQRRLTVLEGGRIRERYAVAVGAAYAPTPTGRFAVTDRLSTGDPSGPYGCCILALSAQAPHAIQGWSGGNRIAIHSTPETWSIGEAASHGCVRLTLAEGRWLLEHIPLGTPTLISS